MPSRAEDLLSTFLADLRPEVQKLGAKLADVFEVYAEEAIFGRAWLQSRLDGVPAGGRVLEVGAGLMLLSCALKSEGYEVVALEPIGTGFSDFHHLQQVVLEFAQTRGIAPTVLPIPVEDLLEREHFDLAFSLNVMEHVGNVTEAIAHVVAALKPGAAYSFFCPNYTFPYEPHFGIPIVGSKQLTARLFKRFIQDSRRVQDPLGVWGSLNWISVGIVDRACSRIEGIHWSYDRSAVTRAFQRVTTDPQFASRRAPWMRRASKWLVATGAHRLASLIPASLQPAIDCTIVRKT